jgi:hypothetical protein
VPATGGVPLSTVDAHIAEWEAVLEREGLGLIDSDSSRVRPQVVRSSGAGSSAEAADEYMAWARDVMERCPFVVDREDAEGPIPSPGTRRWVWAMHAEGSSLNQIASELAISRRAVKIAIRVTKAEAEAFLGSTAPVVNPWRCSGREEEQRKLEADEMKDQRRQVEYARIKLKEAIAVAGKYTGRTDIIPMNGKPLYGIPHALGIDVEFETEHHMRGQKRKCRQVITIPAWKIEQADQVPDEAEPAA